MRDPNRVFSEQEVADIMQRAVDLHETAREYKPPYVPGVSKEELHKIAEDIGISPEFLEQAIKEATAPKAIQGPIYMTKEFERVIEGELDPADYDILLEVMKPMSTQKGVSQIGRSLEVPAWTGWGDAQVKVQSRNGRTRLSVKASPVLAFFMSMFPSVMGSVIALGALGEQGMIGTGIAIAAGLLSVGYGAFRGLLRKNQEASAKLTRDLAARIEEEVGSHEEVRSVSESTSTLQQRLTTGD